MEVKRRSPEQVFRKLYAADRLMSQGQAVIPSDLTPLELLRTVLKDLAPSLEPSI